MPSGNATTDLAQDIGSAVAKTVPPITIWALTLNDWLALASIFYVFMQTAYLIRKWIREEHRRRNSL